MDEKECIEKNKKNVIKKQLKNKVAEDHHDFKNSLCIAIIF